MRMGVTARSISAVAGVELLGFDPRAASAEEIGFFQQAFRTHHMVLIRGFDLDPEECVRISEWIGTAKVRSPGEYDGAKTMMISNAHVGGHLPEGELYFHSDGMFYDSPLKAISLYAQIVPSSGGETRFSNSVLAFQRLPVRLRERVRPLRARHVADNGRGDVRRDPADFDPAAKHAIHPLVLPHPETGALALVASKMFTDRILDIPISESRELLEELFEQIDDSAIIYEHRWQVGDFLIWDNRMLQHARNPFDSSQKRALLRVPIVESATPVFHRS